MNIECRVTLEYDSPEKADIVYHSTRVDDAGFVEAEVKGSIITALVKGKSVSSLIHTLDDYLACVSLAEMITDKH